MKLKEYNIIKFCLILFLILFLCIYFIELHFELETIKIKNISTKDIGKTLKIKGKIIELNNFKNTTFIKIKDNSSIIKGILFDKIILDKKINYEFIGKVSIYENELELIIKKIK